MDDRTEPAASSSPEAAAWGARSPSGWRRPAPAWPSPTTARETAGRRDRDDRIAGLGVPAEPRSTATCARRTAPRPLVDGGRRRRCRGLDARRLRRQRPVRAAAAARDRRDDLDGFARDRRRRLLLLRRRPPTATSPRRAPAACRRRHRRARRRAPERPLRRPRGGQGGSGRRWSDRSPRHGSTDGVRVCGVAPGPLALADDLHAENSARAAARTPLGRPGDPRRRSPPRCASASRTSRSPARTWSSTGGCRCAEAGCAVAPRVGARRRRGRRRRRRQPRCGFCLRPDWSMSSLALSASQNSMRS